MEARQWSLLEPVLAAAVRGDASLPGDATPTAAFEAAAAAPPPSDRATWRLTVSYYGPAFSGFAWQREAPKPTVEGCLQSALLPLTDGRSELRLSCAGRTDAGVSALAQLVSFHSGPELQEAQMRDAIERAAPAPGALRLVGARRVGPSYHATFSTTWRRYAFLLPPPPNEAVSSEAASLDALLRPLARAGAQDYAALGRGVPSGKNTTLRLHHAAARPVQLPGGAVATRIDLVGDRFLRRQVRVLVATAVALRGQRRDGGGDGAPPLLAACTSGAPERTAPPAPALGLVFMAAGCDDELEPAWWGEAAPLAGHAVEALRRSSEYAELGGGVADEPGGAPPPRESAAGEAPPREAAAAAGRPAASAALSAAAFPAALALLEQQAACGAPLDVLLLRHVRAHGLGQRERAAVAAHLDRVARCHGRLGLRLAAAGVAPSPRSRLLASARLCPAEPALDVAALPGVSAEERAWLRALQPPLEALAEGAGEASAAARLECPLPLWPRFQAAFGAAVEGELRALQHAAPLDLRAGQAGETAGRRGGTAPRAAPPPAASSGLGRLSARQRSRRGATARAPGGAGGRAPLRPRTLARRRRACAPQVNTLKATRPRALAALRAAGFAAEPTPFAPTGIRLRRRAVALGQLPGLLEGHVEPQDEGSQLIALLLGARPGELVADYCAGAGGKTLALAAAMRNKGRLWALDIDGARLASGAARMAKAGVDTVQRHEIAPRGQKDAWLKRRKRSFDRVLVDAPCSGVGAWRRNPDARWLRRTRPVAELLPLQAEVLRRAATLVRPGGTLVYATCSLLREENDEQLAAFLATDDGAEFALAPPADFPLPLEDGVMRLTPQRHGCDGFFAARLVRREGGWSRAKRKR